MIRAAVLVTAALLAMELPHLLVPDLGPVFDWSARADDDGGDDGGRDDGGGDDRGGDDDGGGDDSGDDGDDDGGADDDRDGDDDRDDADDSDDAAGGRPPASRPSRQGGDHDIVADEIVVVEDAARSHLAELRRIGFRPIDERPLRQLDLLLIRLHIPGGMTPATARSVLQRRFPDLLLDLHHLYRPSGTAMLPPLDFARSLIGWHDDLALCSDGVAVGMIDTGLSPAARRGLGRRLVSANFSSSAAEDHAHGDAVAALIVGGGGTPALLPRSRLYAADAFEPGDAEGDVASVVAVALALDWMVVQRVRAVALSFAGRDNAILAEAIRRSSRAGLVLVAAAGNDGPAAPPAYPAALPEVVAVTAVDHHGAVYAAANRGPYVDVAAPGVRVPVTDGAGTARLVTGTSFAVPFVVAALAADPQPEDGEAAVLRRLASAARDLGAPGRDPVYGVGLVQAPRGCSNG